MRAEQGVDRGRIRGRLARALLLATSAVLLGLASPVSAVDIDVDAPAESTVGETVTVSATVTDSGAPVADAVVAVTRRAELGGTSSFVELDRGFTDEAGVVVFEFVQYADSSELSQMRIEYQGPDGLEAAEFELTVLPGPQQYVSSAGVRIGILNVSWLAVLVGVVWITLIVATAQLVIISRARDGGKRADRAAPYLMVGFAVFTAVGMFTVVLTQPPTHANLAPNEPFGRAPGAIVGEKYDYRDPDIASSPADLSGEVLYIQHGCSGCHGLGGRGATVGGELTRSTISDIEEVVDAVRSGPKGMPVYSEQALSEAEIERLIDYLSTANGG